jgi:transcriptional regulator with XRE-family HTH domain
MTNPGSMLRDARERAGLTQSALANRAGTSQATLSAYESGAKQPTLDTFLRLIAAAGSTLTVEPAPAAQVAAPTRAQLGHVAKTLPEVIGLAEALPHRHHRALAYPPLEPRPAGR